MEYGSRLRFALITIGGIILLILSIWGVSSLARRILGNDTPNNTTAVKKTDLATFNKQSSFVRLTLEGPVVASEKYQSYQIEVGQNYRLLTVFRGYNKEVANEYRFVNDTNAYEAFLKSLKRFNFTSISSEYGDEETGYCATGNRYVYEIYDFSEEIQRTWNTSCSAKTGTFAGQGTNARSLFKKQIPDLSKILETNKLSI